MSRKIGIKTEDSNGRILTRGAFIIDGLEGLIADVGKGFFVVTEDAAEELTKRGVEWVEVEIVEGLPKCEVCGKPYKRNLPLPPVPDCDCKKPQNSKQKGEW